MQTGNRWNEAVDLDGLYGLGKTVTSKSRFSVKSGFGFHDGITCAEAVEQNVLGT